MSFPLLATLNGSNLPAQFSYKPATPKRRISVVETSGNIVIRESPFNVPSDSIIAFVIEGACEADYLALLTLYKVTPAVDYNFTGYWGDVMSVRIFALDPPEVHSKIFKIAGSLRITSVTNWATGITP